MVYPDSEKIPISPYIFGSGDEMNASFSPLSQIQPLIQATRPRILRFGGIGCEYFDWEADSLSGLSYVDFIDTFILTDSVKFGVDSFLRLCETVSALPILSVNMQTADTGLARRMVEYANGDTTTPMGRLRAQRGHPEPYNVTIWSLGNEPDIAGGQWPVPPFGYWTFYRHYGISFANWSWQDSSFWMPADFAQLIPEYVSVMESASPIPLKFIYSIAGDLTWLRPVIEPNIDLIDYLDVHYYPGSANDTIADTTDYIRWLSMTDTILPAESYIQVFRDSLAAIGADSIKPVVLEFNGGIIMIPDPLWWNYLDGLFIADCIGHWLHAGIEMAAVYSIHEGRSDDSSFPYFGIIRGDTVSRRMASYVVELYSQYFGDTLIYAWSDHKNNGYGIESWASIRSSDKNYVLVVINKTLDTTYTMTLQFPDSIQIFHLRNITNNRPIGAPYNGTSGIEEVGQFIPDSIHQGWSFFTFGFAPASITLVEAQPFLGIEKLTSKYLNPDRIPAILKPGMELKLSQGDWTLYSILGERVCIWKNMKRVVVPSVPTGVYFLRAGQGPYKKIIIYQ